MCDTYLYLLLLLPKKSSEERNNPRTNGKSVCELARRVDTKKKCYGKIDIKQIESLCVVPLAAAAAENEVPPLLRRQKWIYSRREA